MKIKNKYFKALVTSVACTALAAAIMIPFQKNSNDAVEEDLIDRLLKEIPAQLDAESEERGNLIAEYDAVFHRDLAAIKYLMNTAGTDSFFGKIEIEDSSSTLSLVRKDGTISHSTNKSYNGRKLQDVYPLAPDEYRLIMEGGGYVNTGVHQSDDGKLFKIFSTSFNGFRLVMCSVLKGRYASVYSLDDFDGLFGIVDERLSVTYIDNNTLKLGPLNTEAENFSGRPISAINLDVSATREPSSGHSGMNGLGYHYRTIQYRSDVLGDLTILTAYSDIGAVPEGPLIILLATILLVTFLLQLYGMYIDEEAGKLQLRVGGLRPCGKKGCTIDVEKARILLPFSLISIVVVTIAGLYLNSLYMVSNQCWTSRWNIGNVSDNLGKMEQLSSDNFNAEIEGTATFLKVTANVLEEKQKQLLDCRDASRLKKVKDNDGTVRTVEIKNPWLAGLAEAEQAKDISVFDWEGKLISTSGTQRNLGFSREDPGTAAVFDVIDGISGSRQFFAGDYFIIVAPFTLDRNGGSVDAILVSRIDKELVQSYSINESLKGIFDAASESGHCLYSMTTATDDHKVIYASRALGEHAANMPDAAYLDGYVGSDNVNDNGYLVTTMRVSGSKNDYFILSFVQYSDVYLGRAMNTVSTFAVTLLVILILLAVMLVYGPGKTERLRALSIEEIEERKSMTRVQLEKMEVEIKKQPSSSQRIMGTMRKIWILLLFLTTLILLYGLTTGPVETLSGYLMSFAWQRGINIFSITTMLVITLSFSFGLLILTKLMSVLGNALNANAETVCQLLVSLLRYTGYIAVVFTTLYMFGVDTTGVLASLGAFSVMVGLGAKNLITDILAGISIIMEKDYKVGDIVNIGGFCGKVSEIGIRTTKVEDIEGNVKIFYNSGVNGVINMTSKPSAVRLDIKLDAKHSFDEAEKELCKFFERICGKYPQIKGDCSYLGVQESTAAFNVYRIAIPCDEIDRSPLRRAVIKEFSEFCKEENIVKL